MWETLRHFYHEIPEWLRIVSWSMFALSLCVAIFFDKILSLFRKNKDKETTPSTTTTTTTTNTETQTIKESDGSNVIVFQGNASGVQVTINTPKQEEKGQEEKVEKCFLVRTSGVFGKINKIRRFEFDQLTFPDDQDGKKKKLFIKFISIPIDSLEKHLLRLENIENMDSIPREEFNQMIMGIMYDHIKEVKEKMSIIFSNEILTIISDSQFNKMINELMMEEMELYLYERTNNESNICALLQCVSSMHLKLKMIFNKNYEKYTHLNGILDKIIEKQNEQNN